LEKDKIKEMINMPRGKRRSKCLKTGKKPTHPRKHKHW